MLDDSLNSCYICQQRPYRAQTYCFVQSQQSFLLLLKVSKLFVHLRCSPDWLVSRNRVFCSVIVCNRKNKSVSWNILLVAFSFCACFFFSQCLKRFVGKCTVLINMFPKLWNLVQFMAIMAKQTYAICCHKIEVSELYIQYDYFTALIFQMLFEESKV